MSCFPGGNWRRAAQAAIGAAVVAVALTAAPAALADGNPDITLSKEMPARTLYGEPTPVTLKAVNPSGPTGYNLSFRDVLPAGVSYVAGSAGAVVGEPQILNNAPGPGQTTLIWSNLADLTAASDFSISFQVAHDQSAHQVGDLLTNQAGAFVNCNPRFVPDFDPSGNPMQSGGDTDCDDTNPEESYTGSASASAQTQLTAIEITKSTPDHKLLRGLHDHQTVYTLEVTNNDVNPTSSTTVEDYIPAGLEFLGCGGVDNTTDAPTNPGSAEEYPGSGPINPGHEPGGSAPAGCLTPDVVETVLNPPGLPAGVYTHVVWQNVANLSPNETVTLRYIAAIPIRANTMDWNGAAAGNGTAPPTTGEQASNLDNNSGPETNQEGANAPGFTNRAIATGTYEDGSGGAPVSDSDEETVNAHDVRIGKSVSSGTLAPGAVSTWSLKIDTSEYRYADSLVVTDTLRNGYCPLGGVNLEHTPPPAESECDPTGDSPSAPYTSVAENANGSWTITWDQSTDPALARMQPSSTHTITFPTRTRTHYQLNFADSTPVLARDTAFNDVGITGDDFVRCAPGAADSCAPNGPGEISHDEPSGTPDSDTSEASQEGPGATIDKQVASAPNDADCLTAAYDQGPTSVSPGDHLCFKLRMQFPGAVETGSVDVNDFIPPGTTYDAGSAQATANNTVGFATTSGTAEPDITGPQLSWPLDDGGDAVDPSDTFEVVFSVTVGRRAAASDGDLVDNLMKAVFSNTAGESFPLRDDAGLQLQQAELTLLKGVRDVDGAPPAGNGPNVDGVTVSPGSTVTYRVDVSNGGSIDATSSEIWDLLPSQVSCADVPAAQISNGGTCNAAENRIEWNGVAVPAATTTTLTYDVVVPQGLAPTERLDNTAGVRQYESPGGGGSFTNIPSDNIDPTQEPSANAGPADDPSNVVIEAVGMSKTRTTEVNEAGNNANTEATIGERIDYTVTTTIPDGTTLYGADTTISDDVGTRQLLDSSSVQGTIDTDGPGGSPPTPLPANGLTISASGSKITVDFPDPYVNALGSGDDIVTINFSTRVADVFPGNQARGTSAQNTLPNQARLDYHDSGGTARNRTASTSTRLVEPNISVSKSNDATGVVAPGDIVTYTVQASNGGPAVGTSVAHDVAIVDTLPDHLTPVDASDQPVPDGGTVPSDNGVWDATAHTITWTHPSLDPGASTTRTYRAVVDPDVAGAGSLVNQVLATTTSMAGASAGERSAGSNGPSPGTPPPGYRATASSSLDLIAGSLVKLSDPNLRTIGDVVTHKVTVTIPPGIDQYDAVVVDDLPDGLAFDSYGSATCTTGCSPGPTQITPTVLTPVANGTGTRIGWNLGDIESAPSQRTVQLVYSTHVERLYADSSAVSDGDTLTNQATLAFNTTDGSNPPPTTPPDPSTYDQQRTATADTDIVEPDVSIDKDVSGQVGDSDTRTAVPGDSFTYTLAVTNNGDAPAYDVTVNDEPDPALTNVVPGQGSQWVTDPWTAGDHAMSWHIPGPIAPDETVTLTYTAALVPSGQLSDDQQVINTAEIPSYFGVGESERQQNGFDYREHSDGNDTVTIVVEVPGLTIDKTTGASGFPDSAPASIEASFPWHIVVTNPNAGSQLFGVDLQDALPANWSYVPGSAQVSGTGDLTPGGQIEPTVSGPSTGSTLSWSDLADLDGGETVVVDFEAVPGPLAAIDPGSGPSNPNVNGSSASGVDSSGASGSAAGPYSDSDDASATLATPTIDLAVDKDASRPSPPAGTEFDWNVTVTNNGPDTAPDAHLVDELPAGLSFVSVTTPRGSCSHSGLEVTCDLGTIHAGDSFDVVIRTRVEREAEGRVLVNEAHVADPSGNDSNPNNNDAEAQVTAGPFLEGIREACTGGTLTATPTRIYAGVSTAVTVTLRSPNGAPVASAPVVMRAVKGGAQVAAAEMTAVTDESGQAVFTVTGVAGASWQASVGVCNLAAALAVQKLKSCGVLDVSPHGLSVGRSTRLKVRLRAPDGKPMRGIKVKAQGAGVKARAVTGKSGRAAVRVRARRSGVVRVSASQATTCVIRLGVAGGTSGSQLTG